jgi:hypothetical protein
MLGEVLLGEVGERDAHASLAALRRGQRSPEGFARVVGGEVPAALDPSRAASVEAVAIGPKALPVGSGGLEREDLSALHGNLRPSGGERG